jgi:O-acetyl-ADP-ribose deacetylase (regulator of RNase III)
MIRTVQGDLLDAEEEYICQQCNCITIRSHGLSASIVKRFPHADPYAIRRSVGNRNMSIPEDKSVPGTIEVYGSDTERKVICMFAQYGMGTPYSYNNTVTDSYTDRAKWFSLCLEKIEDLQPSSIAFPYQIGCGLAGGNWMVYNKVISDWAKRNPNISVTIYKL